MKLKRGDVVIADYSHAMTGSSLRPVLVIQSDDYNQKIHNTVVAQITTKLKHKNDPAHYFIDTSTPEGRQTGLFHDSLVSCMNLATINEQRIHHIVGHVPDKMMQQIGNCLKAALALT